MAEPRLEIVSSQPKPFRRDGMGYVFEPVGTNQELLGVRLKADYLGRRSGDVTAEIVVECMLPGVPAHLHQGRLNLDSTNGKRDLAKALSEQTNVADWRALLEGFCVAILHAERQGEPFTRVGPAGQIVQRHFLVQSLLPAGRPTLLYGPWANGKGWISVGLCVAVAAGLAFGGLGVQQGPTLYLDWEDDQDVFDERVWMICRGLGLTEPPRDMHYRACRGSLNGQVHQIARYVDEHRITLTVLDSVGLAAGMAGERGSYEETALALFDGLRHIRTTHLLIDHVSEEGRQNNKVVGKAYGSIYKMALVRNAWEIRKDQDTGSTSFRVGLFHTKANHGPLLAPLGFTVDFSTVGACEISPDDVGTSTELSDRLAVHVRINNLLDEVKRPLSVKEISDRLNISDAHARKDLNRYAEKFIKTGDNRWTQRTKSLQLVRHDGTPLEEAPEGYARLEDGDVVPF